MKMKKIKKIIALFFLIIVITTPVISVLLYVPKNQPKKYINAKTKAEIWVGKETYQLYFSENSYGETLNVPMIDDNFNNNISKNSDLFVGKPKKFEIKYNEITKDFKEYKEVDLKIKEEFLKINKIAKDLITKNNDKKYICFYKNHNQKLVFILKELKTPKKAYESKNFLEIWADSTDVNDNKYINDNDPKKMWSYKKRNKGHILWQKKTLFSPNSESFKYFCEWFSDNNIITKINKKNNSNMFTSELKGIWQKYRNKNINVIGYPYIDYNEKTGKLMIIVAEGGRVVDNRLIDANNIIYKTITLKNSLPINHNIDPNIKLTKTQKMHLTKILQDIISWLISSGGPVVMQQVLSVSKTKLPQLSPIIYSLLPFFETLIKQLKDYKTKLKIDSINLKNQYWKELAVYKDMENKIDEIAKLFIKNKFDISKLEEISQNIHNEYQNWDINWLSNTNGSNQYKLIRSIWAMLILSKFYYIPTK